MQTQNEVSVAGPQAAAAVAGVVFLAVTVPLFGIFMMPLVALAAAGRALAGAAAAVGVGSLVE